MVTIYYYTLLVKIICANFKSSLSVAKNGKIKYDFELINKASSDREVSSFCLSKSQKQCNIGFFNFLFLSVDNFTNACFRESSLQSYINFIKFFLSSVEN